MAVHMTIKRVLGFACTIASTVLSDVEICWDLFESTFLSFAVMQNIVLREMVCKNQLSPGTHNMHCVFILSFELVFMLLSPVKSHDYPCKQQSLFLVQVQFNHNIAQRHSMHFQASDAAMNSASRLFFVIVS